MGNLRDTVKHGNGTTSPAEVTKWVEFFNEHAPVYNENCFTKNTIAEVGFVIEALRLQPGAKVLDIGCGTGRHAIELARRGYRVTGVDVSSGTLAQAKAHAQWAGVEVTWRCEDAKAFTVQELFDGAICLCEGAFGLLGSGDDALGQPLAILRSMAAALRPGAKCLFTVLNGFAMARRRNQSDVEQSRFDPLTLAEWSVSLPGIPGARSQLRERGFVPTELKLLFQMSGLEVSNIWGGTAGNWGRRKIDLDEMEIMVLGGKSAGT